MGRAGAAPGVVKHPMVATATSSNTEAQTAMRALVGASGPARPTLGAATALPGEATTLLHLSCLVVAAGVVVEVAGATTKGCRARRSTGRPPRGPNSGVRHSLGSSARTAAPAQGFTPDPLSRAAVLQQVAAAAAPASRSGLAAAVAAAAVPCTASMVARATAKGLRAMAGLVAAGIVARVVGTVLLAAAMAAVRTVAELQRDTAAAMVRAMEEGSAAAAGTEVVVVADTSSSRAMVQAARIMAGTSSTHLEATEEGPHTMEASSRVGDTMRAAAGVLLVVVVVVVVAAGSPNSLLVCMGRPRVVLASLGSSSRWCGQTSQPGRLRATLAACPLARAVAAGSNAVRAAALAAVLRWQTVRAAVFEW